MMGSVKKDHVASIPADTDCSAENHGVKTVHTPRRNDDTAKGRRVTRACESFSASLTGLRVDHEGVF
jgi:hypothetical protein